MAVSWIRNTEDRIRQSVAGFQRAADHFLFLYFLMCAAIELEISTFLLFCPKYSTNSPSGPTRYMMIVWSTWRQQEVTFRHGYFLWFAALLWHVGWLTTEQVYNSRCSRCLRLSVPDCNKLCRLWRPPQSELVFPSGRSASGKTLKKKLCIH